MQAIVVSEETLPGATHINEGRQRRGFAPLQVRVVSLIGAGRCSLASSRACHELIVRWACLPVLYVEHCLDRFFQLKGPARSC